MARANRHYIPGHVRHITHRCHKKEFLLKFARDRQGWLDWLFEARKRYGLVILNFMATSNHTHLLVHDRDGGEIIPRSIQLAAGRTAQEYNQRKLRKGAFWEDRYHATAVQADQHLVRCIVYIDLNMVRAGVIKHPREWPHSGYHEIQRPPERYRLIDRNALMQLLGIGDSTQLSLSHHRWVEKVLGAGRMIREGRWSESIAVGSLSFADEVRSALGARALGRRIVSSGEGQRAKRASDSLSASFCLRKDCSKLCKRSFLVYFR